MFVNLVCLVLAAFSSVADASLGPSLYTNYQGEYAAAYDNYVPKPYAFEYGVSDPHTGDHKSQWETKDEAGTVRGSYSLLESDGSTRIVDYIADDHGFRAVVKKLGIHGHPESIQSHGGEVLEAPLVSPIIVAEPGHQLQEPIQVPESLPGHQHINYQSPLPVEAGPLYHSYDGGLEHYQNLYNTQPLPFNVPEAQGVYVDLPRQQLGGYAPQSIDHIHLQQSIGQQALFAPSQAQQYVPEVPPQGLIASKIDDLEPQYGPSVGGGYQVPQYIPQAPVEVQQYPVQHQVPEQYPVQHQGVPGVPQGGLPVDDYRLELAYGEPQSLGAPKLVLGGQEVVGASRELVGQVPSSYAHQGNSLQPQARYEYVQDYGQDGGRGDLGLNQGEYLPPGAFPVDYKGQGIGHK